MRKCPSNIATWRSLVSGTGLDRVIGKEARFGKRLKSE